MDRELLMYRLTNDAAALMNAADTLTERARMATKELLEPAEEVSAFTTNI